MRVYLRVQLPTNYMGELRAQILQKGGKRREPTSAEILGYLADNAIDLEHVRVVTESQEMFMNIFKRNLQCILQRQGFLKNSKFEPKEIHATREEWVLSRAGEKGYLTLNLVDDGWQVSVGGHIGLLARIVLKTAIAASTKIVDIRFLNAK